MPEGNVRRARILGRLSPAAHRERPLAFLGLRLSAAIGGKHRRRAEGFDSRSSVFAAS